MTRKAATPGPAFVLHHWDWSETSLILDLFTREQGRVAVVAKGAKRPYSQLRAVLLPYQRLNVALVRPRGSDSGGEGSDIVTLRSAEYAGGAPLLPSTQLLTGFYLNELLLKLLARQDPHERLFDAYADALATLAQAAPGDEELALRAFELVLLRETGVLPDLGRSTLTQSPVLAERHYQMQPELGLVASDDSGLSGAQCLALQSALDARLPAALRSACVLALPALRQQLRGLLHYHLGSPELRTRQTMRALRRLHDAAPEITHA